MAPQRKPRASAQTETLAQQHSAAANREEGREGRETIRGSSFLRGRREESFLSAYMPGGICSRHQQRLAITAASTMPQHSAASLSGAEHA